MASATPEKRLNLAQQLVQDLSQQILSGELPAGSKLPTEEAVTKARGVSRTVVREAMSRLQAEGLVETRRGIGTFVVDAIPAGDFQSASPGMGGAYNAVAIIELRLCLEVEAAAMAAQRATPEQLAAMRAALDGAVDTQSAPCMRTDFEFHLQIAQCTGNSFFIDTMTHLGHTLLAAQPAVSGGDAGQRALEAREREQVHAAITRKDAGAARAAMRLHLINCLTRARRAVSECPKTDRTSVA
ncbi:FadR/GntR family transcriptional regulator [Pseudomonas kurunegalensis]|uniref:FadR/GntR family transcriptional regulator n=1 Tax=Pseudomonas kurunegalensis TaxID=485880 RepID=UPI002570501B|nr:FadR/GntR family transcriptional regulator [Pseudomonas kurunegalensis]WJD60839.1 FadR/GntR family transcriptional regulator [Pseudomonas kurunegalensis]